MCVMSLWRVLRACVRALRATNSKTLLCWCSLPAKLGDYLYIVVKHKTRALVGLMYVARVCVCVCVAWTLRALYHS
jgi:hypothetical protein